MLVGVEDGVFRIARGAVERDLWLVLVVAEVSRRHHGAITARALDHYGPIFVAHFPLVQIGTRIGQVGTGIGVFVVQFPSIHALQSVASIFARTAAYAALDDLAIPAEAQSARQARTCTASQSASAAHVLSADA